MGMHWKGHLKDIAIVLVGIVVAQPMDAELLAFTIPGRAGQAQYHMCGRQQSVGWRERTFEKLSIWISRSVFRGCRFLAVLLL